jgi:hypothetical protein
MGFILLACNAPLVKNQSVAKIKAAKNVSCATMVGQIKILVSCAEPLGGAPTYVAG